MGDDLLVAVGQPVLIGVRDIRTTAGEPLEGVGEAVVVGVDVAPRQRPDVHLVAGGRGGAATEVVRPGRRRRLGQWRAVAGHAAGVAGVTGDRRDVVEVV